MAGVRVAVVVAALGAAATLAACGVPTDSHPVDLASGDVPFGLVGGRAFTDTTLPGPNTPVSLVQVYFVSGDRLVAAGRAVPSPATLERSLTSLLAGPTPKEADAGIRSAIGEDTTVLDARVAAGRAAIDLSASFADSEGADQILAVGQLVYTATALPGVGEVSFELAGVPVAVPAADGTLQSEPVTRQQYAPLLVPGG